MSKHASIQKLEKEFMKKSVPEFHIGDTIKVHTWIREGNKQRIQIYTGTVIARKGCGVSETISVHRVAHGVGMERVFPIHSPTVEKIELVREGDVRRAKLYYLRGASGKKAKVKGRLFARAKRAIPDEAAEPVVAQPSEEVVEEFEAVEAAAETSTESSAE
ncbi:MAG: 50S ribosomal protein L19 [Chlamydiia bacterium]|nr:50S ribosomal protein L19 [Chlamydiia bacterium]